MEIILYIYFGINILITTYFLESNLKWEGVKHTIIFSSIALLFGGLVSVLLFLLKLFAPILGWLYKEVSFQYRFYCTDYWDKILLDDNYSETYKTREEKLKRSEQLTIGFSKQIQRHNKQVQKKYGNK